MEIVQQSSPNGNTTTTKTELNLMEIVQQQKPIPMEIQTRKTDSDGNAIITVTNLMENSPKRKQF